MQVVIPAEATLDIYKAAYVIFRERNLRFANITIAYPVKGFRIDRSDICIGVAVQRDPKDTGKNYNSLQEVMTDLHRQHRYAFLTHIPNQLLMCYREHDKTVLAVALFAAFDNFRRNFDTQFATHGKTDNYRTFEANNHRVICADSKDKFLTPEERIFLFKSGYHYIVFLSDNTVGIQKTLRGCCPLLTDFAKYANLNSSIWFTHQLGHLVITKNNRTPDRSIDEMCNLLEAFLSQKPTAADAAD